MISSLLRKRRESGAFLIHPTVTLTGACSFLLFIQAQSVGLLSVFTFVLTFFSYLCSKKHFLFAFLRIRYFILALFIFFSWGTPGRYLWPEMKFYSPTYDGLCLAMEHAMRLICVLAVVNILFSLGGRRFILAALYGAVSFLKLSRTQSEVFTARVELVLSRIEREGKVSNWRALLYEDAFQNEFESTLKIQVYPLRLFDIFLFLFIIGVLFLGLAQ